MKSLQRSLHNRLRRVANWSKKKQHTNKKKDQEEKRKKSFSVELHPVLSLRLLMSRTDFTLAEPYVHFVLRRAHGGLVLGRNYGDHDQAFTS